MPHRRVQQRSRFGLAAAFLPLLVGSLAPRAGAAEPYRLQSGDVVEFAIAGYPDLTRRATVDLNGIITLPVVGDVSARDLTLTEVRRSAADRIASKSIPTPKGDGTDSWAVFTADQIVLVVAEYRPVYMRGDVAAPGQQAYRPGLTVRQAVANAGDYQIMRVKVENPYLLAAQLEGEFKVFSGQLQTSLLKIARLEAQLGGRPSLDFTIPSSPISAVLGEELKDLEQQRMTELDADHLKEKAALDLAMKKSSRRMELLEQQQQTDVQGTQEDAAELSRVKGLFSKGLIQITRIIDAQRAVLLSATRALETNAQVTQLERELVDLERSRVKLDDQRQIDLTTQLQAEKATLAQTRSQMESVSTQLFYLGALRSDIASGTGRHPVVTITRQEADRQLRQIAADEDSELLPGDVVDVSLRSEYADSLLTNASDQRK